MGTLRWDEAQGNAKLMARRGEALLIHVDVSHEGGGLPGPGLQHTQTLPSASTSCSSQPVLLPCLCASVFLPISNSSFWFFVSLCVSVSVYISPSLRLGFLFLPLSVSLFCPLKAILLLPGPQPNPSSLSRSLEPGTTLTQTLVWEQCVASAHAVTWHCPGCPGRLNPHG